MSTKYNSIPTETARKYISQSDQHLWQQEKLKTLIGLTMAGTKCIQRLS